MYQFVFPLEDHNAFHLFWRETVTISRKEAVSDESGRKTKVCAGSAWSLTFHSESFP